jgi:hypothetical protein
MFRGRSWLTEKQQACLVVPSLSGCYNFVSSWQDKYIRFEEVATPSKFWVAFQIHDLAEIEERLRYILVVKLVSLRQDASSPCAKLCRVYDCRNARFQHFQR